MKLVSLYANNFKKLQFDNPLKFPEGITAVSGLNESGKSTVLDAILYSLYGKVTRPPGRVKDTDLIGYGTGKATLILTINIGGKKYQIKREIFKNKTNTAILDELLPNGRLKPIATHVRAVTSTIENLLGGISFNEIVSSNIVAQKDLDRLVRESTDRRKVINAFLNLESFNTVLSKLHENRKDLEGTGMARQGFINLEQVKLDDLSSKFSDFKERKNDNVILNGELDVIQSEIKKLEKMHDNLKTLHKDLVKHQDALILKENLSTKLEGKNQTLTNYQDGITDTNKRISEIKVKLKDFEDIPTDEQISEVQTKYDNLSGTDRKQEEFDKDSKVLSDKIEELEKELKGFDTKDIDDARTSRISLKPQLLGTIISFLLSGIMFFISIPIIPWISILLGIIFLIWLAKGLVRINKLASMEGLLGKAEILDAKKLELSKLMEEFKTDSEMISNKRKSLVATLDDIPFYKSLKESDKDPENSAKLILKQYATDTEEKGKYDVRVDSLKKNLEMSSQRIDHENLKLDIKTLRKQIKEIVIPKLPDGIQFSEQMLDGVSSDKEETHGKIERFKTNLENKKDRINENNQYIKEYGDIEKDLKSQEKTVTDLKNELKVIKAAIDGISKTAEMLRTRVKPGVERYMGEILPSMTANKYKAVTLDEAFGVQIWDPEAGEFRPKEVFSGGTEDQFLLAMRLSFALALMPEIKGTKPDFLFLDEPLGSSDEARRSGIIDYLNIELIKLFSQIFIISHVGGLEELVQHIIKLDNGKMD